MAILESSSESVIPNERSVREISERASLSESLAIPSQAPQTASEFIDTQLQLEADAREALPYAFDRCTKPLGSLRQTLFSCLTCNPAPQSPSDPYNPAGLCYSCSIACHGEHNLVELFNKRNFSCDCGTTRLPPSSPCTLRIDPMTGTKGPVHSQTPASGNSYDKNFQNRFCGCGEFYDAQSQKGTMYQCLGLATEQDGGCGEDWWHPECLLGLNRRWMDGVKPEHVTPTEKEDLSPNANAEENADETQSPPPGFPSEDDFDGFICYKCVDANPWIKKYAGTAGFLDPVFKDMPRSESVPLEKNEKHSEELISSSILVPPQHPSGTNTTSGVEIGNCSTTPVNHILSTFYETQKSKPSNAILSNADIVYPNGEQNSDESHSTASSPHVNLVGPSKKRKSEDATEDLELDNLKKPKLDTETRPYHESLPPASTDSFSLFLREGFRDHFCRCAACYSLLRAHPQLLEEEESYEPPLSEDGNEGRESVGTGSLLDRGEAALNNIDRVRAIEGVMVYNHLKDKVKSFLQPFAASGQPVGAEDIKAYFEKLRGDDEAIKAAGGRTVVAGDGEEPEGGHRRAQSG